MKRTHFGSKLALLATVTQLNGATAGAQNESDEPQPPAKPDLLAGPEVNDEQHGRPDEPGFEMDSMVERLRTQELPRRLWLRELRALELTDEQQQVVESALQEFQTAVQEHRDTHREQLQEIRKQLRAARRNAQEVPQQLRQQLRRIREQAPSFEPYQQRIWESLTVKQRKALTDRINIVREQMIERLEQRRQARGQRGPEAGAEPGPDLRRRGPGRFDEMGLRRMLFLMRHQTSEARRRTEQRLRTPPPPGQ